MRKFGNPEFSYKPTNYYNLDVIISVGYRVNSLRGTQFRMWATQRLREYIVKGFAMDDDRLKQAGGGNYFEELLARTGYSVISYCRDLAKAEAIVATAIMFGVLDLEWAGQRFGFHFPLEDDPRKIREKQRMIRKDYRPAIKKAGRILAT
ncbi:MAG TPA: RhuM family protein [Chroococcales cyanobacterium]